MPLLLAKKRRFSTADQSGGTGFVCFVSSLKLMGRHGGTEDVPPSAAPGPSLLRSWTPLPPVHEAARNLAIARLLELLGRYFLTISAFSIMAMPPRSAILPFKVMVLPQ
jgi:hypothetical protein